MPTKKQLAALAKGRAIRKENIKKNKTMKRKTKAEYEKPKEQPKEKKIEKSTYKEPTKIIIYNGEPIEVPISKLPKGKNSMKKLKKYAKNAAIAVATLGALGYGAYNSKKLYDNYLHVPVDIGWEGLKAAWNTFRKGGELIEETKNAWKKSANPGRKFGNVVKLYGRKGLNVYAAAKNKIKQLTGLDEDDFTINSEE